MFCDPILGCYKVKAEMMWEEYEERARKRKMKDFDPFDYHGTNLDEGGLLPSGPAGPVSGAAAGALAPPSHVRKIRRVLQKKWTP